MTLTYKPQQSAHPPTRMGEWENEMYEHRRGQREREVNRLAVAEQNCRAVESTVRDLEEMSKPTVKAVEDEIHYNQWREVAHLRTLLWTAVISLLLVTGFAVVKVHTGPIVSWLSMSRAATFQ